GWRPARRGMPLLQGTHVSAGSFVVAPRRAALRTASLSSALLPRRGMLYSNSGLLLLPRKRHRPAVGRQVRVLRKNTLSLERPVPAPRVINSHVINPLAINPLVLAPLRLNPLGDEHEPQK